MPMGRSIPISRDESMLLFELDTISAEYRQYRDFSKTNPAMLQSLFDDFEGLFYSFIRNTKGTV